MELLKKNLIFTCMTTAYLFDYLFIIDYFYLFIFLI